MTLPAVPCRNRFFVRLFACAALLVLLPSLATAAHAQAAPQPSAETKLPVYDVVSIRENKNGQGMRWQYGADSFTAENTTLTGLIMAAYDLRPDQISGLPPWADSFHFNIQAKVVDGGVDLLKSLKGHERMEMLRPILAQRFGFRCHMETRDMPIYELLLAKGGARLTAVPPAPPGEDGKPKPRGNYSVGNGRMDANEIPIGYLVEQLAYQFERNVIDKTGLTGNYTFKLRWTDADETPTDTAPSLFTALREQLGLRLQPSRGPVALLVVDHAEQPTGNDE